MQDYNYLSLPNRFRKLDKILYSDILYLESNRNYTIIHLQDGTVRMSTKTMLFHINNCLNDNFIRIHRAFCVNKNYIQNFDKKENIDSLFLKGGIQLAISRRKRRNLLKEKPFFLSKGENCIN
jgi:DNA-binding LytR/AlgR family response regulator